MATFGFDGLDDLISDLGGIAAIPDSVLDEMLDAETSVVIPAQKRTISSMWTGPNTTGISANSVTKSKSKKTKDGRSVNITFKGSRTRKGGSKATNNEIAFINEFGKRGQNPRPAIKTANDQSGEAATDKAAEVLDNFYQSKNL